MNDQQALRDEEARVLSDHGAASDRFRRAVIAVQRQFYPNGDGAPSKESLQELDEAEKEYKASYEAIKRIAQEIREGKRR